MKSKKTHEEKLRAAAIVRLKYELDTGKLDDAFKTIYAGVLSDLGLEAGEVERFLQENRESLLKVCRDDG